MVMRRKSERNKAKASPEKKVEKPTRKSTRRRAKKSPSTSPDRDNSNDAEALQVIKTETPYKTRLHNKEAETITTEEPEAKVSSTETIPPSEVADDSGSVWKAARADASPGEIPKLKLCRQRNLSETSDVSTRKKNKSQESGEGAAEEADSADEKPATSGTLTNVTSEAVDNPSSTLPGQDSQGEEVSDSKEIPPEIASADLSDNKPNIDRQDDTIERPNCPTDRHNVDSDELAGQSAVVVKTEDTSNGEQDTKETVEKPPVDGAKAISIEEPPAIKEEPPMDVTMDIPKELPMKTHQEKSEDHTPVVDNTLKNIEPKEEILTLGKDTTSSEDEKEDEKKKPVDPSGSSENSNDEARKSVQINITRASTRTTRRKHRDKYRDSSNSDSADSDDEPIRTIEKIEKKPENERELIREQSPEVPEDTVKPGNDNKISIKIEVDNNAEDEKKEGANDKQKASGLNEKSENAVSSAPQILKPTKVSLKRSFTRISTNTDYKKDSPDVNDVNQDKENHVSGDQVEVNIIPKKRRWGTARTSVATPAFSISTDFLKTLVPGAKPLSISEVRLTKDDDDDDRDRRRDKRYSVADGPVEKKEDIESIKNDNIKNDNHIAARRKVSIVKDTSHLKSPSPSQSQLSNILLIKNLVRPFTLNQIKELLSRTGTIVENGFWMDRIKSKCFVEYSNEDQAFETRQALHGISWPLSNPKKLQVEYATKEEMEQTRESSKDLLAPRKTEPMSAGDMWQQGDDMWGRDEKSNATTKVTVVREWDLGKEDGQHLMKEKEREKKDLDKKRRQRSRSPAIDPHLPAPARKFKKKEDEPPPAKLLDDLFRKTKATPCIYWLPLTNEQIVVKEEMRRQHMAEHARRLEEMRRTERNRDGRRRRSPRK